MVYGILHLLGTAELPGAGIARIVGSLATNLDRKKYSTHAYFLGADGPLVGELEAAGAKVRVLRWSKGVKDPLGAYKFWRSLRGGQFAIIHQHFGGRSPRWIARNATGAKVIAHLHGHFHEARGLHPIPLRVPGSDLVIATSRAVAEWVISPNPIVVYPAVPIPLVSIFESRVTEPPAKTIIGTAGRLVPMKGFVHLIRAVSRLRTDFMDAHLEIAGDGPLRIALENEVQALGLKDHVTFIGWQSDMKSVFERWHIYVQPSLVEPFGIAALEAQAAGLAVIATVGSGLQEFIEDGRTGWLVPAGDPAALADRLRRLLLDSEQRRVMGVAGRTRVQEHFSLDRMVAAISDIYDNILNSSVKARSQSPRGNSFCSGLTEYLADADNHP